MLSNARLISFKFLKYANKSFCSIELQKQWLTHVGAQPSSKSLVYCSKLEYKQLTRDSRLEKE